MTSILRCPSKKCNKSTSSYVSHTSKPFSVSVLYRIRGISWGPHYSDDFAEYGRCWSLLAKAETTVATGVQVYLDAVFCCHLLILFVTSVKTRVRPNTQSMVNSLWFARSQVLSLVSLNIQVLFDVGVGLTDPDDDRSTTLRSSSNVPDHSITLQRTWMFSLPSISKFHP
jgi:hypothetical protein